MITTLEIRSKIAHYRPSKKVVTANKIPKDLEEFGVWTDRSLQHNQSVENTVTEVVRAKFEPWRRRYQTAWRRRLFIRRLRVIVLLSRLAWRGNPGDKASCFRAFRSALSKSNKMENSKILMYRTTHQSIFLSWSSLMRGSLCSRGVLLHFLCSKRHFPQFSLSQTFLRRLSRCGENRVVLQVFLFRHQNGNSGSDHRPVQSTTEGETRGLKGDIRTLASWIWRRRRGRSRRDGDYVLRVRGRGSASGSRRTPSARDSPAPRHFDN